MKKIYYGWYIVLAAFLSTFISVGLTIYSFSIFLVPMTEHLHVSRTSITLGLTLFTISMGLFGIWVGGQMTQQKVRRIILLGIILMSSGYLILAFSEHLFLFYSGYILLGLGCACVGPVLSSSLMTVWFEKYRGLEVGITSCGASVCAIVFPKILTKVIENNNITTAYIFCAIIVMVLLLMAYIIIKPHPKMMGLNRDGRESQNTNSKFIDTKGLTREEAIKTKTFWLLSISFVLLGLGQMGIMQNAAPFLKDMNFENEVVANSLSYIGIAGVVSAVFSGWLSDISPKGSFVFGNIVLFIGGYCLMQTTGLSDITLVKAYAIFFGLGMANWSSSLPLITGQQLGVKYFGAIWGIIFAFKALIGDAFGAPIVSNIASFSNYNQAFIFPLSCLLLSSFLVLLSKKEINN